MLMRISMTKLNPKIISRNILFYLNHSQQKHPFWVIFHIFAPDLVRPASMSSVAVWHIWNVICNGIPQLHPGQSDRCSHWTWKPLVMHVSLDHPWWWPEVRELLPLLWHGNSFEFQHFYDVFAARTTIRTLRWTFGTPFPSGVYASIFQILFLC